MNQTTLSIFELKRIFKDIKEHFPNAIFTDEICNESRIRQENIASISEDYDLVIVIGDKNSSNTTKLFDIANKNKNRKNYLVSNLDEVKTIDLSQHKKAVLFSGTSCPKYIIDEIFEYVLSMAFFSAAAFALASASEKRFSAIRSMSHCSIFIGMENPPFIEDTDKTK